MIRRSILFYFFWWCKSWANKVCALKAKNQFVWFSYSGCVTVCRVYTYTFFFLSPCSYLRKKKSNYKPLNPGAKVPKAVTRKWVQVGAISPPCTQTLISFFVIILLFFSLFKLAQSRDLSLSALLHPALSMTQLKVISLDCLESCWSQCSAHKKIKQNKKKRQMHKWKWIQSNLNSGPGSQYAARICEQACFLPQLARASLF